MADANTNSAQQAQDAQNFDNLTSLQQGGEEGAAQGQAAARADAPVTTNNPNQPDNPSLYNETKDVTNTQTELRARGNDSVLDATTIATEGRDGRGNETNTIGGEGTFGTEVNVGQTELTATVQNETPDIRGNDGDRGSRQGGQPIGGSAGANSATTPQSGVNQPTVTNEAPPGSTPPGETPGSPPPSGPTDGPPAPPPAADPPATPPTAGPEPIPEPPTAGPDPIPEPPIDTNPTPTTPTIISSVVTVYVQLFTDASVTEAEGALLTHTLKLVDKNGTAVNLAAGKQITVTLSYTSDATDGADFSVKTTSYTITGNGGATYSFSNTVKDDFLAEGSESYTVTLASVTDGAGANASGFEALALDAQKSATGTIVDTVAAGDRSGAEDTVYVQLFTDASVTEAEGALLTHTLKLVDKNGTAVNLAAGKQITVTLSYTSDATDGADFSVKTTSYTITGNGGATYSFSNTVKDDFLAEGSESYTVTLASVTDGAGANASGFEALALDAQKSATGTIVDTVAAGDRSGAEDTVYVQLFTDASVTEAEGALLTHTLKLVDKNGTAVNLAAGKQITVTLSYTSDATDGADFSVKTTSYTITGNGGATYSFSNTVKDDFLAEGSESYTVTLASVTDGAGANASGFEALALDAQKSATGTIVDTVAAGDRSGAEDTVYVQLFTDASVTEAEGALLTHTLKLVDKNGTAVNLAAGKQITVTLSYTSDATDGADFSVKTTSYTITGNGGATYSFSNTVKDDFLAEGSESYTVTLASVTDGAGANASGFEALALDAQKSATGTIVDTVAAGDRSGAEDTVYVQLFTDASVTEAEGALLTHTLKLVDKNGTAVNLAAGKQITVTLSYTSDATDGADFSVKTTSYTITGNGGATYSFSNTVKDDFLAEGSESYTVTLASVTDGAGANASGFEALALDAQKSATGTIVDTVAAGDRSGAEDTVYVQLFTDASVTEAEGALLTHTLKLVDKNGTAVNLAAGKQITVTLSYTSDATDGADFSVKTTSYTITGNGGATYSFSNTVKDDFLAEGSESYTVTLASVTDGAGANASGFEALALDAQKSATGTIVDTVAAGDRSGAEDTVYVQLFTDASVTEAEGALLTHTLKLVDKNGTAVNLAAGKQITVTLSYTSDATDGADFSVKTTSYTITGNGGATYSFSNTVKDDFLAEGSESYTVTLASVTDGAGANASGFEALALDAQKSATGTIVDTVAAGDRSGAEDTVYVQLFTDASVTEAEGALLTHTLKLVDKNGTAVNLAAGKQITVTLSYTSDATDGADFSVKTTSYTITGNGGATYSFSNTVKDDFLAEGSESYTVTLASVTDGAGANASGFEALALDAQKSATGTIVDNDITTVNLSASSVTEDAGNTNYVFTATLSNPSQGVTTIVTDRGTITIGNGETTGTLTITSSNTSDVYLDASSLTATITSATGGNFEQLDIGTASATARVTDTTNITTVNLSASSVTEDAGNTNYVFTATLSNPSQGVTTIVTDRGTITIGNGETTGTLTITSSNTSDVYLDASSLTATITSATGGNFEQLDIGTASATARVTDTTNITTVNLSASSVTEDAGNTNYVFTATLSNPSQGVTTIVTDRGTITIGNGETTGTLTITSSNTSDVYLDASSLTATITSATGGNFEQLDIGTASATARVTDTTNITTVNLSASSVTEDAGNTNYVFTATLSNPSQGVTTIVTDRGTITIGNGETTGTLTITSSNTSDVYLDASSLTATITSATGGNFEQLDIGTASATARVTDTTNITTVNLSASSVTEDAGNTNYVFTATLSNPSQGVTTIVTDRGTITIGNGETTGTLTITSSNTSDVYLDASSLTATITSATGGNFEQLDIGTASATARVTDTTNITTVNLSASSVTEDAGNTNYVFTATLSNPSQGVTTIVTDRGTITIGNGETTGTLTITSSNTSDVYLDASSLTATITSATGGNFEQLDIGTASATARVTDTTNITTVNLSASSVTEDAGNTNYVFTATLSNPSQGVTTIVTDRGTITIGNGETTGTLTITSSNTSDVYLDASSLTATITSATGGNFEQLDIGTASATARVTDTTNITTVNLSASSVTEDAGNTNYVFTATLSNPSQGVTTIVTDRGTITIGNGETTGTLTITSSNTSDVYLDASSLTATITSATGGNFEQLDIGTASATARVTDTTNITTVNLSASSVTEDAGNTNYVFTATLSNPSQGVTTIVTDRGTITIGNGETTGTLTITSSNTSDVYLDASSLTATITSATGGNFEQLDIGTASATARVTDTTNITTVNLSASSVTEDAGNTNYVFTATLSNPSQGVTTIVTDRGTITIGNGETTGTLTITSSNTSDVYLDASSLTATITSATGGNFEQLDIGTASATARVTDTTNITTVNLSASSVTEDAGNTNYVFTATLSNPSQGVTTIVTDRGTITIGNGETTGTLTITSSNTSDVYLDASSLTATITSATGGNFEQLDIGTASATARVTDTTNITTVNLSASSVTEDAGNTNYVFTATLSNPSQGVTTIVTDRGTITIGNGETTGTLTITSSNTSDVYLDASSLTATITSATGGNFEQLDIGTASATARVTDTTNITTVNLSASSVTEDAGNTNYVFTATLSNPSQGVTTIVTDRGTITIGNGETTGTLTITSSNTSDVYLDASSLTATITSATGGNFEQLDIGTASATARVTDTTNITTVNLSASSVTEDAGNTNYVFTATLSNPSQGVTTIVTDRGTITIGNGETTGTLTITSSNTSDVYLDASSLTATITSATGGNFEQLDIGTASATARVTDTTNITTVNLSASSVTEDAGNTNYVFTATLSNPSQGVTTIVTDRGTITIGNGETTGTLTITSSNTSDVYLDASSLTATITSATGGNFEQLDIGTASATARVTDTTNITTVNLSASSVTEDAGNTNYVFTATLSNPSQGVTTIVTDRGTITIGNGETTGTLTITSSNTSDVYLDASSLTATITSATGGNFEQLDIGTASATARVTDTTNITTVNLSASSVTEDAGNTNYVFTATLSNPSQGVTTIVTDRGTITIGNGETTGTLTITSSNTSDVYLDASSLTATITSATGGNFEQLDIGTASATARVTDTTNITTVNLSASSVTEDAGNTNYVFTATLSNPSQGVTTIVTDRGTITIGNGETTGTLTITSSNTSDVYLDASSLTATITSATGGNFEQLDIGTASATARVTDTTNITTVNLSASSVTEDAGNTNYVFTATLSNPSQGVTTIVTDRGTITIGNGETTGTLTITSSNTSDVYLDASSLTATITSATGGNFEQLDIGTASATARVTDTTNITTVNLSASSVTEDAGNTNYVFTATLSNPSQGVTTIVTDRGTITIGNGETTGTLTITSSNTSDVYLDASSLTATITSATGGNFEQLDIGTASATARVTDTTNITNIVLRDPEPVQDGTNNVTIIAEVANPVTGSDLFITLSNDATITIRVGETIGVSTPFAENAIFDPSNPNEGTQLISIRQVSGGNFEAIDSTDTAIVIVRTPELTLYKSAIVTDLGGENGVGSDFGANRSSNLTSGYSGEADSAGDKISYTLTVQNTGKVALDDVKILDHQFENLSVVSVYDSPIDTTPDHLSIQKVAGEQAYINLGPLAIGQTYLIKYDYTVTTTDIARGYIENTATISSNLTTPSPVTEATQNFGNTDGVAYSLVGVANISDVAIRKFADVNAVAGVDSRIEYQIYVTNEGTGSLSGIKVADNMFATAPDTNNSLGGKQLSATLYSLKPDGSGYNSEAISYTIGSDGKLDVGNLAYGQYAVISYTHIVTESDYKIFQEGIEKSLFDYANIGDKLDQVRFSYGTFDAYINKVDADPYSTVYGEKAKLFFNVDNTGLAVGVNAGVMAGDRNGNSDHLRGVFDSNPKNDGKSAVEGVSIVFTNAKDVELAFKVNYGKPGIESKTFDGSIVIGSKGSVTLREIDGTGPSSYQLNGYSSQSGSTYKFINTDIPSSWFTVTEAFGPGGAQNKLYTLKFSPGDHFINSFDFSVVGDSTNNSADQIKVVDVKFDTIDFIASNIVNIATVDSNEDKDLSDSVATNTILVTSTVNSDLEGLIDTDITAPTISNQSFTYDENQTSTSAEIATVVATDTGGVTGFRFADSLTTTSLDGRYAISSTGQITLTSAGLASEANDFEVGTNIRNIGVQAQDAAGNWSNTATISLNERDVDDTAPTISNQSFTYDENQTSTSAEIATVVATDTGGVTGFRFADSLTTTSLDGRYAISSTGQITLTSAGLASEANDFEVGTNIRNIGVQAQDAAGNWSNTATISLNERDVDDTAPTISNQSFTYDENQTSTSAEIATVVATDTGGVTGFRFADSLTTTSLDGRYAISSTGQITLTSAGLASEANDFEVGTNIRNIGVQAQDAAGNWSNTATISLNERDVNDTVTVSANWGTYTLNKSSVTINFVFSQSVDPASFTISDLAITRDSSVSDSFGSWSNSNRNVSLTLSTNSGTDRVVTVDLSPTASVISSGATLGVTKTPIALDLSNNGMSYLAQDAGVTFDYNNDGIAEATAWVAPEDGILAIQGEEGTHNIVFSTQVGETDLQGLAKVYDSNKDGIFDALDTEFAKFGVWQDSDSDGIVDDGEFRTLADRGITSLSLTSDNQVRLEADGDVIVYGQTTYTMADGSIHIAEDVGFVTGGTDEPLDFAAMIANAEAIQSVSSIDQLADAPSTASLFIELGGQTYEIATTTGQAMGAEDLLTNFLGADASTGLLTDRSWTDVIDIASEHGGPNMILAEGGSLTNSYANSEGDWTVIINSGEATVDAANKQITFASESAENSVTIITADGASHDIDNVDKIQWHG